MPCLNYFYYLTLKASFPNSLKYFAEKTYSFSNYNIKKPALITINRIIRSQSLLTKAQFSFPIAPAQKKMPEANVNFFRKCYPTVAVAGNESPDQAVFHD
jgi:hypothetical protein